MNCRPVLLMCPDVAGLPLGRAALRSPSRLPVGGEASSARGAARPARAAGPARRGGTSTIGGRRAIVLGLVRTSTAVCRRPRSPSAVGCARPRRSPPGDRGGDERRRRRRRGRSSRRGAEVAMTIRLADAELDGGLAGRARWSCGAFPRRRVAHHGASWRARVLRSDRSLSVKTSCRESDCGVPRFRSVARSVADHLSTIPDPTQNAREVHDRYRSSRHCPVDRVRTQ